MRIMRKPLLKFFSLSLIVTMLFQMAPMFSLAGAGHSYEDRALHSIVLSQAIDSDTPQFPGSYSAASPSASLLEDPSSAIHSKGYVSSRITLQPSIAKSRFYTDVSIPSFYDLRTQDGVSRVSSVKNQGSSGSCWAFAAIGSMESCLLPFFTFDFSENNLKNESGFDLNPNTGGGNNEMAIAYFARWGGPLSESDDSFNPTSVSSNPVTGTVQKHLQNAEMLPGRTGPADNTAIKKAIMEHGAVSVSMYMGGLNETKINQGQSLNYYTSKDLGANHAVNLVGWIDARPASDFKDYANGDAVPPGDGAFIVKNSWGSAWGESGFFYISFYDANLAYDVNYVFYGAESAANYADIYQYDSLGCTVSVSDSEGGDIWMANVFTKRPDDGPLTAVSFYTLQPQTTYNVYVCPDYSGSPDLVNERVSAGTGIITGYGYYTVDLDIPVSIASGDRFAVIVQLSASGSEAHAPVELALPGYSSQASAHAGESFVSVTGSSWDDLTGINATANFCLKAFTSSSTIVTDPGSGLILDRTTGTVIGSTGSTVNLEIPSSVQGISITGIGDAAFSGNPFLGSVTIPASVTSIGNLAFDNCTQLSRAVFQGDLPSISPSAFGHNAGNFKLYYHVARSSAWSSYKDDPIQAYCIVTQDLKNGSPPFGTITDNNSGHINAPDPPSWTGYFFGGWFKEPSCSNAWDFATDTITSDIILYARWEAYIRGDVTLDVKVDALDLLKLKKHLLGQVIITGTGAYGADVTGDGKIDALDLLKLKKYLLGQITLG